jgi:hypothetical protein
MAIWGVTHFPLPVFWVMRGGGAGSWGVVIDAAFRTFPIFNATVHNVTILTATLNQSTALMTSHTMHINDWDGVRAGQSFTLLGSTSNNTLSLLTVFKDLDSAASKAQMSSFLNDARALGAVVLEESTITALANDLVELPHDLSGFNNILNSRLVPNSVYLNTPSNVRTAYKRLLLQGVPGVSGALVAGGAFSVPHFSPVFHVDRPRVGQLAANVMISSAIHPAWRTAKTLVSTSFEAVRAQFCPLIRLAR